MNRRTVFARPGDSLIRALEFFGEGDFDNLPIVDDSDGRNTLLGHISYRDIIGFYQREHESSKVEQTAGGAVGTMAAGSPR